MDETCELVRRARSGDQEAFGALAQGHIGMLVRIAYQMIGDADTAHELAQEAILQAYLSLRHLRDESRFRSWLYGIGVNVCRSYIRTRKAAPLSLEDLMGGMVYRGELLLDAAPPVEEVVEVQELHQRLFRAVEALTPADREAVLLFYYDGMSIREAAALLGTSPGAVRVRLHKARKQLREHLLAAEIKNKGGSQTLPYSREHSTFNFSSQTDVIEEAVTMLPVEVLDVTYIAYGDREPPDLRHPIIMLLDEANERVLPIWIGTYEGEVIRMLLSNSLPFPRPMTWAFMNNILGAVGAQVEAVTVSKVVDEVYYGITNVRLGEAIHEIDSRPSDAIGLALYAGAPIFVAEDVMDKAGIKMGETFKAGLAERKRLSRATPEEMAQLFPPTPPAEDVKIPTQEELEAASQKARDESQERIQARIGK